MQSANLEEAKFRKEGRREGRKEGRTHSKINITNHCLVWSWPGASPFTWELCMLTERWHSPVQEGKERNVPIVRVGMRGTGTLRKSGWSKESLAELELTAESQQSVPYLEDYFSPLLIVNMFFQIRFYICLHLIAHPSGRTQSCLVLHQFGLI